MTRGLRVALELRVSHGVYCRTIDWLKSRVKSGEDLCLHAINFDDLDHADDVALLCSTRALTALLQMKSRGT